MRFLLVGAAFFLSGAAALVYQVAWQRILELSSGIGIYSVAMIVAAFMAGLGIGSHAGSVLSTRLRAEGALRAFAALEMGVALFGALSCYLYYDLLYRHASWLYAEPWRAGVLHFLSLLVPTGLMGMSLPFLTRAMVSDVATAGRTIGVLYGINLLGASLGALATPWLLIRFLGLRGAVLSAAAGNALACLAALLAGWRATRGEAVSSAAGAQQGAELPDGRGLSLWMALYALSGFCALSLEILWFRFLDIAVRSTAFTFGTVLALYLFGCAVGALAGSFLVSRFERPLRAFLIMQCVLLAWSGAAVLLVARLPVETPLLAFFAEAWKTPVFVSLGPSAPLARLAAVYLGLPAFLFGLPTVLMGLSFPVLQRAVQDDVPGSGRKVGLLQASNIAGCLAGSLLAGLLLLSWFGTTGTFRVVLGAGVVFAGVGIWHYRWTSVFSLLAALLIGLQLGFPGQDDLWSRLHGSRSGEALVGEDATGVAALTPTKAGWKLWINGMSFSSLPFGGLHTRLGAIPAVLHPAPRNVAIIGLGSGDTAWAVGCRGPITERITVFEICGPNLKLLERVRDQGRAPATLLGFLGDPRIRHVVADGRNSLQDGSQRYDVIEIDALWPTNAYSGNLYSFEFFALCASRLNPGGLMCSWSPTPRVRATFRRAFRNVVWLSDGQVVVGSNQPIPLDVAAWDARLSRPEVEAYLGAEWSQSTRTSLLSAEAILPRRAQWDWLNRDLFPRDEFRSP